MSPLRWWFALIDLFTAIYYKLFTDVLEIADTIFPHADHHGGISNMRVQINNYPAGIITKSYFR